jgi:hydrophobe/amphiphile efflux-3 (HAE3) family protein
LIGIGIDYAIQFHNRIDEELAKGKPLSEAAITPSTTWPTVIIALVITEASMATHSQLFGPLDKRLWEALRHRARHVLPLSSLHQRDGPLSLGRIFSSKTKAESHSSDGSSVGAYIEMTATFCIEKWKAILTVALVLAVAGNYVDSQVPIETNMQNYIPQDLEPLIDLKHMKAIFGGTDSIKLLVQADDITAPDNLRWMDDFGNYLLCSREERTESVASIATYLKAANGGEIPDDKTRIREIISSLPEDVQDAYLSGHNLAVIDVSLGDFERNYGTKGLDLLIKSYESDVAWMTPPPGVSVSVTGESVLFSTLIAALTSGRREMSLMGLVFIFILLLLIYKDPIKAILPVLPMIVVIGSMGEVMYAGGLKYTPLTATLGALIFGVGSEYAILMMERFYEELENVGDIYEALKITANNIGSALVASGMTTIFGFAALIASPFTIISDFGLVTVLSVVFALITTFTVFVVLMMRMEIRRQRWVTLKQKG